MLKILTIFNVYKYCIYKNYGGEKKDVVAILVRLARNYQETCMKVSSKATALQKKNMHSNNPYFLSFLG